MTAPVDRSHQRKPWLKPQWVLVMLVLGVLFLSSLAFSKPISQKRQDPTSVETQTKTVTGTPEATATATEDEPPTPEEIGYTDGIIFCSTVLVLILLVGTLRETLRRKGR